ncbi:Macoilin,Macoilin-2,Macoilin-1 [Acanthosepion pharaonis]|uniref:Macoilin n=1 Tax=Acanthosepion pharaonis TaxID=158019 RepID=A0A812DJ67_ACAPH|nr:Macoilin,Macoilin-2,Macoilin-1 [Sepia pharaonis]
MKRRNGESGKLRRPMKRSKITDSIYGSTFLYLKFLVVWALVIMADFILEFRFEYLWPFWLLLRSVYDSFKYQGLAFSVFFVCIAITSDVICYLFIPVQWLFFAASTYVWVHYVWHTERGICLPTVSLWLLFVYIEASVRLRELKSLPFNLALCRPFAAHCIGYPVVTLGFGFKSYISYRMRLRKQKEVQKANEFYILLLMKALPPDVQNTYSEKQKALPQKSDEEVIANGVSGKKSHKTDNEDKDKGKHFTKNTDDDDEDEYEYIEQPLSKKSNVNDYDESAENEQHTKTYKSNTVNKSQGNKLNSNKENNSKKGKNYSKDISPSTFNNNKDEIIGRLENDVKRLKADLQSSRNTEQELRTQIANMSISEKSMRSELYQLQQDNENLQNKLHNLVTSRQQDKQNISILERKLQDACKNKCVVEQQLASERKAKKAEESAAARAVLMAAAREECNENCKARRRDTENDLKQLRRDLKIREEQFRQLEREVQSLRQYKESQGESEILMSALAAMQDKNTHLENSLSAETRLKLDLFSALGEAKREIEILKNVVQKKDFEIKDIKSRMAETMALLPSTNTYNGLGSTDSSPLFSSKLRPQNDHLSQLDFPYQLAALLFLSSFSFSPLFSLLTADLMALSLGMIIARQPASLISRLPSDFRDACHKLTPSLWSILSTLSYLTFLSLFSFSFLFLPVCLLALSC